MTENQTTKLPRRYASVLADSRILMEIQKVCGQIESEFGISITKKFLVETLMIDYLRCLLNKPPDPNGQKYLYYPIGGYRPTQKQCFLPPVYPPKDDPKQSLPKREDIEQCQLQNLSEKSDGTGSEPATYPPYSE